MKTGRLPLCALSLLNVYLLDRGYFWGDEKIVLELISRYNVWEILIKMPVHQPHLPTWYLLPKLLGVNLTLAVSAVCLPAAVYITMGAAADGGSESAMVAGFAMAMSPFLAQQAGWLRMYSMLTLLAALTLYGERWAGFVASLVHPFGVLLTISGAIEDKSHEATAWLAFSLVPGVWLAHIKLLKEPAVNTYSTGVGHGAKPGVIDVLVSLAVPLVGAPLLPLAVLPTAALGVWLLGWHRSLAWLLVPTGLIVAASIFVHPVWAIKYTAILAPAAAVSLSENRWGRRPMLLLSAVLATISLSLVATGAFVSTTL